MNAAIGTAGVTLGFVGCLLGAVTLGVGLAKRRPTLVATGRSWALVSLVGAVAAIVAMERALITRDFSVLYVAENGSTNTPALYNVATLWAALEGSILLWALVLIGYVAAVAHHYRARRTDPLVAWALLTMFVVGAFFFFLLVGPADPFTEVAGRVPTEGPGPNPLLQNHPLMAFHPPMLYLGYVGFTVPFGFAVAALVTGRVGEGWVSETRRWTLFAWGFLTVAIVLGAWWSYEVLGWGGYWAWDPVENASFLPWLTGTAYLHSVIVQERRGMLRVWNLSLLCATFSLTILGTFLTRAGVLDSVHEFTESSIGPLLLGFFGVTVAVTLGLIGWRGDRLRSPGRIDSPVSREGAFLANNVLFAGFALVVLLGTVFPLVVEATNGDRISVGTPYFDRMTMPVALSLLFLMAVAPALPWRKGRAETLGQRLHGPAWTAAAAVVVAVVAGGRGFAPLVAFALAGFGGGAAVRQVALAVRRNRWRGLIGRTSGGMVVHVGVVLLAVGFAASSSYVRQDEFRLLEGESASLKGHTITYLGTEVVEHAEKTETRARFQVDDDGVYEPAINQFRFGSQTIGTPSVRTGPIDDVYLALLDVPDTPAAPVVVRVIVQPLVSWLWVGGGVMGVGAVLAAVPERRRHVEPEPASAAAGPADRRESVGGTAAAEPSEPLGVGGD